MHRPRTVAARTTFLLSALSLACGGDSGPLDPDQLAPIDVDGTWYSVNETTSGVPLGRYDLVQNGSSLTGEAFWEWEGALERIGTVAGTVDPDGTARWTTTLNDNGWDGVETVEGRFTGVDEGAENGSGTIAGTWEWRSPSGQLREGGTFQLDRPGVIELPQGTGSLGAAGPWMGAMLYSSLGNCHTTGFVMAMSLSVDGANVTGTVSAKPHPRGGELPKTLAGWLGPMYASVSGSLLRSGDRATLSLTLSGNLTGFLDGDLIQGANATQFLGVFQGAKECEDARGGSHSGTFVFNSTRPVVY